MVLGKLPVPGRPTIWMIVGQGPTAVAVGAGGGCLDIFVLIYPFSPLSHSLWETARYRLKYCLKGPINNQPKNLCSKHCLKVSHVLSACLNKFHWLTTMSILLGLSHNLYKEYDVDLTLSADIG